MGINHRENVQAQARDLPGQTVVVNEGNIPQRQSPQDGPTADVYFFSSENNKEEDEVNLQASCPIPIRVV